MGYDKLIGFLNKNLHNNSFKNIFYDSNESGSIVANHIFFDITFIIYLCITKIEEDIDNIIKCILAIKYVNKKYVIEKIEQILKKDYWQQINFNINKILSCDNVISMIDSLKEEINKNINELLSLVILFKLKHIVNTIHVMKFIKSINLFFDGIPSYSKILEQRKRRLNNYIDSKERKELFKKYFNDIEKNVIEEDGLIYDYFVWLDNKFNFNKSIGPFSYILLKIQNIIKDRIHSFFPKIKITIDFSINYGEADFKILKFIENKNKSSEIFIHSCDSDFIYFIILFQLKSNQKLLKINYNFIRYNVKNEDDYMLINATTLINNLIDKYKIVNKLNNFNKINFIFDFLVLVFMFGNDILPPNYEINTELSLALLFETHYLITKEEENIINLSSKNLINFYNFKKWLTLIKNKHSQTIIILNKYYKLPYNFIIFCTDKLNYNIHDIINKLIIPYLSYQGSLITYDKTDIRSILFKKNKSKVFNPLDKFNSEIKEYLNEYLNKIFDYSNINDYGLIKLERVADITNNSFQNLYNFLNTKVSNSNKFNYDEFKNLKEIDSFFKNIKSNFNTKTYLETLYVHIYIYFKDFNSFSPYLLSYYNYLNSPPISEIINFIDNNDMNDFQIKIISKLKQNKTKKYFCPISHHLFITPYLIDSIYIDEVKYLSNIKEILTLIKNQIDNIWFEEDNNYFNLKDINPMTFIEVCDNAIRFYKSKFVLSLISNNQKLLL